MNLCKLKPSWRQGFTALALTLCSAGVAGCAANSQSASNAASYPCDDKTFLADRSAFASGQITGDQAVDICGTVTAVYRARNTRSGRHGYFYVNAGGSRIEIVSNLDAMRGAPASWPWVSVGDQVTVRGRYYYDNPQSQGIDWTEGDTGRSWSRPGYVVVCDASGKGCQEYQ